MENFGFKGLLRTLWQRIFLSYKSTFIGFGVIALGAIVENFADSPNHIVRTIGIILGTILVFLKEKNGWTVPAKVVGAAVAVALLIGIGAPRHALAQDAPPAPTLVAAATGPLAADLGKGFSLHLNVVVPAVGYSITQKKFIGQAALTVNYVLDYKRLVAVGLGGGLAQTNDTPGATVTGLLAGPVIADPLSPGVALRPAVLAQYIWLGAVHEVAIFGTVALEF